MYPLPPPPLIPYFSTRRWKNSSIGRTVGHWTWPGGLQFQRLYLLIPRNRKQVRRSDVLDYSRRARRVGKRIGQERDPHPRRRAVCRSRRQACWYITKLEEKRRRKGKSYFFEKRDEFLGKNGCSENDWCNVEGVNSSRVIKSNRVENEKRGWFWRYN